MRTTFNTINRQTQYTIGARYSELGTLQQKIATGKELGRPSDNPVDVANVLGLRSNNLSLKQFERNINDGLSWMQITDTTMNSMNTVLQRGRELAIKGDSDTLSKTERIYLGEEVEQLTRQLISLSNSKFKGDYIFSGSHTDKPPVPIGKSEAIDQTSYSSLKMSYINGTGAAVGSTFQIYDPRGSATVTDHKALSNMIPGSFSLKIGSINSPTPTEMKEGTDYSVDYVNGTITVLSAAAATALNHDFTPGAGEYTDGTSANNIRMSFDFASASRDIYGREINTDSALYREIEGSVKVRVNTSFSDFTVDNSVNMISSMIKLGQSLIGNNQKGIRESMNDIDTSFNRILSAQSENGARVNLFENTMDRNDVQQLETTRVQATLEDADYAESVSKYTIAQTVFNAALQSTAKIMQSSLANYI